MGKKGAGRRAKKDRIDSVRSDLKKTNQHRDAPSRSFIPAVPLSLRSVVPEALPDPNRSILPLYEAAIVHEAGRRNWQMWTSMIREMEAIQDRIHRDWHVSLYQYGQLALFEAIAPACPSQQGEPADLDKISPEQVRAAGEKLNASGGSRDMHEAVTLWTPREVHRLIDQCFNGIGDWLA